MEIRRQSRERPKGAPQTEGVAFLKREEMKTADDGTKQRLAWAVQKALHCNPQEEAACRQAAATWVTVTAGGSALTLGWPTVCGFVPKQPGVTLSSQKTLGSRPPRNPGQ